MSQLKPDQYIKRERIIKKLRALGYRYRAEGKRTQLYSHPKTDHCVNLSLRELMTEVEVRILLQQCGLKFADAEAAVVALRC